MSITGLTRIFKGRQEGGVPGCLMVALMDSDDALRELKSLTYNHCRLTKRDSTVRRKLVSLTCTIYTPGVVVILLIIISSYF